MRRRLDRSGIFIGFIAMLMAGSSLLPGTLTAQPYPGATWSSIKPEDHQWSGARLNDAWSYAQTIGSGAVLIVDDGVVVGQWGEVDRKWPRYRIANYATESYYHLEALLGDRTLAFHCGLNKAGQIIYLNTIEQQTGATIFLIWGLICSNDNGDRPGMPHERLIRLLNFLWLFLVFPAVVAIFVGFLGHSATLGIKTALLIGSGVAILSPLLTAILGSRDT
jgi:hypothetical protein